MIVFEPQISRIGSNLSTNCATTTVHNVANELKKLLTEDKSWYLNR